MDFIFVVALLSALISGTGSVLFRIGHEALKEETVNSLKSLISYTWKLIFNRYWFTGGLCYAVSWAINMHVYQHADLSFTKPFITSNLLVVVLLSRLILKEELSSRILVPVAGLIFGIILLGLVPYRTGSVEIDWRAIQILLFIVYLMVFFLSFIFFLHTNCDDHMNPVRADHHNGNYM